MRVTSEVSKRYAKALFELVAQNKAEEVLKELRSVQAAFNNDKLKNVIVSPVLSRKEKEIIVGQIMSGLDLREEVEGLVKLLALKDRLSIFSDVVQAFETISDEKNKVLRGVVKSAGALSDAEKSEIEEAISKFTGYQLLLDYKEDPSLIGGMIAQVGSHTFDGTLNTQLMKLKEEINRRAN